MSTSITKRNQATSATARRPAAGSGRRWDQPTSGSPGGNHLTAPARCSGHRPRSGLRARPLRGAARIAGGNARPAPDTSRQRIRPVAGSIPRTVASSNVMATISAADAIATASVREERTRHSGSPVSSGTAVSSPPAAAHDQCVAVHGPGAGIDTRRQAGRPAHAAPVVRGHGEPALARRRRLARRPHTATLGGPAVGEQVAAVAAPPGRGRCGPLTCRADHHASPPRHRPRVRSGRCQRSTVL